MAYHDSWISSDGSSSIYDQDNSGGVASSTDALGNATRTTHDGQANKTSVTAGFGSGQAATTTFTYQNGLLVQVVDPDDNVTTFGYDSLCRLVSMTDPLANTATRTYNDLGQLASITNRDGLRRDFAYDITGRLVPETWYAVDGMTVTDTLRYTYNAQGLLATASNNSGTYTFGYDGQGRVISVTEPFGVSLTFPYDAQGNRTLVQDSFGGKNAQIFEAARREPTGT